jgi:hypothetical protein
MAKRRLERYVLEAYDFNNEVPEWFFFAGYNHYWLHAHDHNE